MLLLLIAVIIVGYALINHVLLHPDAENFLRHKSPEHPVRLPVWLSVMRIHLSFACLALLAGAINFSPWVRRNYRRLHKRLGYAYLVSVLVVSVTSGYMAPYATGGKAASIPFNLLNILWPAFTVLAINSIRKKRLPQHQRWMVRSYAFCFTNTFVHGLAYAMREWAGMSYEDGYAIAVIATLALLLLLAEAVIQFWFRKLPTGAMPS